MHLCHMSEIDEIGLDETDAAEIECTAQAAAFLRSSPTKSAPVEDSGVFTREDHRIPSWMLEVEYDLARTG